jgi:hypothetical protein
MSLGTPTLSRKYSKHLIMSAACCLLPNALLALLSILLLLLSIVAATCRNTASSAGISACVQQ